jgi:hypothetical protein
VLVLDGSAQELDANNYINTKQSVAKTAADAAVKML